MKKKKNKVTKYIALAKANPIQAYLDLINLVLVLVFFAIIFSLIFWVENVFEGTLYANPVMLKIGGFSIYWHGILIAASLLAGIFYIARNHKKMKIKHDHIAAIVFWVVFLGIIGGRVAFVLINWGFYSQNTSQVLNIWEGGVSFYGSLVAGFLTVLSYCALRKIDSKKLLDLISPALFIGLAIGSWGSFFNQEKIGKPTYCVLKMFVEIPNRPWLYQKFSYFHPLFLYESILFFLFLIILLIIKKRKKLAAGSLFALAILFYSLTKFALGFLDSETIFISVFNLTQITSIIVAVIAMLSLYLLTKKNRKE